jgi:D-alanyl-D-alanine carboxypeptidase
MKHIFLAATIASLLSAAGRAAAADPAPVIPDTPAGHRIASYVAAFNAGEDQMRAWTQANMAPSAFAARSADERAAMYGRMRADMKTLTPTALVSAAADRVVLTMQTGGGDQATFEFDFDGTPDERVTGIRIQIGAGPGLGAGGQPQHLQRPRSDAELTTDLDTYLGGLSKAAAFSGVVAVARNDQTIYARAFGLASNQYNAPNTLDTRFNLGSINKLMTRIAIEQLVEQHALTYTDTLDKLLPDYPNKDAAKQNTLRQLVDMTSGIGDFFGPEFRDTPKDRIRSLKDYLPFFASKPPAFAPGTGHVYSNGGYVVLGLIIEHVSGQSYYDYVQRHIFEPAGMTHSAWFERDTPTKNVATGYTKHGDNVDFSTWHDNMYEQPARGSSAGGGYATAGDLMNLAAALKNLKLLDAQGTTAILGGGLGVAGGSPGCNAALEIDPHSGYTIVVLSNYDPPSAENVDAQIRAWLGL